MGQKGVASWGTELSQREASRGVSSASLAKDRLPVAVLLEEGDERLKNSGVVLQYMMNRQNRA